MKKRRLPAASTLEQTRERLRELGRRSNEVLVLAAVVGVLTGVVVAGFEKATGEGLFHLVLQQPLWAQALIPSIGLLVCALTLRAAGVSPSTSDEYIKGVHRREGLGRLRDVPLRIVGSIATLGAGAPLGYEGPALYAGAGVGTAVTRRAGRALRTDPKVLLVAGAAAGVAAIFKAPVTGLVFALEVPYQDDLARRMVLPASIAAASSYVTFAALVGTEPILPIAGQPPFDIADLGGAALVGVCCGLLARAFVAIISTAKRIADARPAWQRVAAGGSLLAGTVLVADRLESSHLALGPGYEAMNWALEPAHSVWLIVAVGTLRVVGTAATVGAGGAGGLFIPLVVQGALIGRVLGDLVGVDAPTLLPVVGMAAFLGAGYRVPLAAVVFVAEVTGRPGFVIPGLIAAVVAQLAMGRRSISPYQVPARTGHLEARLGVPVTEVLDPSPDTVPVTTSVHNAVWTHLVGRGQRTAVVTDGDRFVGLLQSETFAHLPVEEWRVTTLTELPLLHAPTVGPAASIEEVLFELEHNDVDRIPVCDGDRLVGVVTASHLLALSDLLGDPP